MSRSLDLEKMKDSEIPTDWEIAEVLDDILFVQFVDVADEDGYVKRGGVLIKVDPSRQLWRVGKVIKHGPKCSSRIVDGTHVLVPNDKGIHIPEVCGLKNVAFINEERIFGICIQKQNKK